MSRLIGGLIGSVILTVAIATSASADEQHTAALYAAAATDAAGAMLAGQPPRPPLVRVAPPSRPPLVRLGE